ncbi:MAG: LCP family protein [Erysipelotrichaceae bacterium]|nr:LCP family protein [Erysipelotrichaceae bacterium]
MTEIAEKIPERRSLWKNIALTTICLVHITSLFLVKAVIDLKVIPGKYIRILAIVLGVLNLLVLLSVLAKRSSKIIKFLTALLCVLMIGVNATGTYALPYYKGRVEKMFVDIPDVTELYMNVYALQTSGYESLDDLVGKKMGIQTTLDIENQQLALEEIEKQLDGEKIDLVEYEDFYAAVEALYKGEVDAIMLNDVYAEIVSENDDYASFAEDAMLIVQITQQVIDDNNNKKPDQYTGDVTKSPFIVGIAGSDNFKSSPTTTGRTDANIVCVVNPNTRQILMITIPRDSHLPIGGDTKKMDKITHASIYGIEAWKDTVSYLLGTEVNFYVRVNFRSLIDIVDALGGLTINNPYAFTSTKHQVWDKARNKAVWMTYSYAEGTITMTGNETLLYVRERYALKDNDMGRNQHQAIVLKALIDTVISKDVITKADALLTALEGKFLTNMTSDQIFSLVQMQLSDMSGWHFTNYSLTGRTGPGESYAMGKGKQLSMVFLNDDSINEARQLIQRVMNNEILSD